jgi:hypothetical protein
LASATDAHRIEEIVVNLNAAQQLRQTDKERGKCPKLLLLQPEPREHRAMV